MKNISPPTKRFIATLQKEHQAIIDSFTPRERSTFQKLCEDLELEGEDEITLQHKAEATKELSSMFSQEAMDKREQFKEDQQILMKYTKLNLNDVQTLRAHKELTGKDILKKYEKGLER